MPVLGIVGEAWSPVPTECSRTADWPEIACYSGSRRQVKRMFNDRSVLPFGNRTNREDDVVQKLQAKNSEKCKRFSERISELFPGSILTSVSETAGGKIIMGSATISQRLFKGRTQKQLRNRVWPFLRSESDYYDLPCDVSSFKKSTTLKGVLRYIFQEASSERL